MPENLKFKCKNQAQKNAIEALAYHIADVNYMRERQGDDWPEIFRTKKTISLCFEILDKLGVPFWVQNSVICYAEDWRRYQSNYMSRWLLKNCNIDLQPTA